MVAVAISLCGAPWPGLPRVGGADKDAPFVGDPAKVEGEDALLVGVLAIHCHAVLMTMGIITNRILDLEFGIGYNYT